ncbi:MAG: tetratricopeptide repeat protein [Nitrospirae bacterium]|nr:tetratricopeptide repeat protein [Nitrospirota bacterium]
MKIRSFFSVLIFFIVSGISYADDSVYQKHIALGISALEVNNYRDSADEFKAALIEHPDDHTATLYLGIAQSRSGNKEAGPSLKKALSLNPKNPRTNLELGIFYFNQSAFSEAKEHFNATKKLAPQTELSDMAEKYLRAMDQGGSGKPWSLLISLGGQYDTNVAIIPDDRPMPLGVSDKSDWRAVVYLKGKYTFISNKNLEGSAGYSLYQSLHSNLSDFNVSQHLFDLKGSYTVTPSLKLTGTYTFEYVYLGGDGYDYAHSISPSLTLSEGNGFSTVLEYRYQYSHFMNTELFTTNSFRTGSNNLAKITQIIPLRTSVAAKVGYAHDENAANKEYWDYSGDKFFAGLTFSLPHRMFLDLSGEYYSRDFEGISPASNSGRKDTSRTVSAALTKAYSNTLSITLAQLYTRNKSNIEDFDYKRGITSLFLNVRF